MGEFLNLFESKKIVVELSNKEAFFHPNLIMASELLKKLASVCVPDTG